MLALPRFGGLPLPNAACALPHPRRRHRPCFRTRADSGAAREPYRSATLMIPRRITNFSSSTRSWKPSFSMMFAL